MKTNNFYKKNNEQDSVGYPMHAIKFLNPQNKFLDCETDGLLDFEVQTTLELFQKTKKN